MIPSFNSSYSPFLPSVTTQFLLPSLFAHPTNPPFSLPQSDVQPPLEHPGLFLLTNASSKSWNPCSFPNSLSNPFSFPSEWCSTFPRASKPHCAPPFPIRNLGTNLSDPNLLFLPYLSCLFLRRSPNPLASFQSGVQPSQEHPGQRDAAREHPRHPREDPQRGRLHRHPAHHLRRPRVLHRAGPGEPWVRQGPGGRDE